MHTHAHTHTHTQVKDPEKYGFSPKTLLDQLTDIYLHLNSEELARAVATDDVGNISLNPLSNKSNSLPPSLQRSYRKDLFETCISILQKNAIKSEDSVRLFRMFAQRANDAAVLSMREDITYGDIPDDFKGNDPRQGGERVLSAHLLAFSHSGTKKAIVGKLLIILILSKKLFSNFVSKSYHITSLVNPCLLTYEIPASYMCITKYLYALPR